MLKGSKETAFCCSSHTTFTYSWCQWFAFLFSLKTHRRLIIFRWNFIQKNHQFSNQGTKTADFWFWIWMKISSGSVKKNQPRWNSSQILFLPSVFIWTCVTVNKWWLQLPRLRSHRKPLLNGFFTEPLPQLLKWKILRIAVVVVNRISRSSGINARERK